MGGNMTIRKISHATLLTFILSGLISSSAFSGTTVYKKVMPDGTVVYSDEEIGGAEKLNVEPVPTIPALKLNRSEQTNSGKTPSVNAQGYSSLEIIAPSNGSAFHSGSGTVEISVSSTPELKSGHVFKYFLNQQILSEQRDSQLILENVDRGTHSLSVHIADQSGQVLKSSTSTFTIHRPSVRN